MAAGGGMDELADILPQVSTTLLDEEDLFDIKKALISVAAKWEDIGIGLGIKQGMLDEIEKAHPGGPSECFGKVLIIWLRRSYNVKRFGEPTWQKLLQIVSDPAAGNNPALALRIAKNHLSGPDFASSQNNLQEACLPDGGPGFLKSLASDLRQQLQLLNKVNALSQQTESKTSLIKDTIQHFVGPSLRAGASAEDVKKVLSEMYDTDVLVSGEVYEWALSEVGITAQALCPPQSAGSSDKEVTHPPLFSMETLYHAKETLYHASLCCYAVCTRDANTYKDFFNKDFPNHNLEEVSLSLSRDREEVDRYLIARCGKTYYVAFQSEPLLAQWLNFSSFQEGIKIQSGRIPLRFFVQQMQSGYRIVFTGFSFGGLLALSLAALLWKMPYLSTDLLKDDFVCITFGQPIISLPIVQEVREECPEFESVVHSIFTKADLIPRLMKFLDQKYEEEQCVQILLTNEIHAGMIPKSQKNFQGSFSSLLLCYFSALQEAVLNKGDENTSPSSGDVEVLEKVKTLLKEVVPHLMAKNGSKYHILRANSYLMQLDSLVGLTWKVLRSDQLPHELGWLKTPLIESLGCDVFSKHSMEVYHRMLFRGFIDQPPKYDIPSLCTSPVLEMKTLKPAANSVAFHRHGKEVAVTLSGDNLWFCHEIKVGSHTENVTAEDASQKSIQFNFNFEDETRIPFNSDQIKVALSNHFSNPVKENVPVTHKVYQFTFRQEQLARLTPSELIETAYLSALLEQHQSSNQHQCFSSRFSVLRDFLEQVVAIVPVESILYSITFSEVKTALQCCAALQLSQLEIPPSVTMIRGSNQALIRLSNEAIGKRLNDGSAIATDKEFYVSEIAHRKAAKAPNPKEYKSAWKEAEKSYRKHISKSTKLEEMAHSDPTISEVLEEQHFYLKQGIIVSSDIIAGWATQDNLPELRYIAQKLLNTSVLAGDKQLDAICGVNLQCVYPMTSSEGGSLKSPLEILSEGRKKLSWLARRAINASQTEAESVANTDESDISLSSLYNAKMLQVVNNIRANELKVCTSLLGAFMEEQIRVPLMKSSIDTARVLNLVMSAAAVGVWALFSLSLGDIETLLSSIPSQSLLVEVRKYIRGIFKEEMANADETYAGKLQFMVQGLDETVSCNSHYISYSLERQLIELCRKLNISTSTPLDTLIKDWDSIFKDDVLSFVVPSYRSLIARWLKWALMVHHLREELAKYTSIGVIGLVNSGKSLLVSSLFGIQVPVGTTAIKRTTVPFLYNLNDSVEGLDVIDFPGVDDRDETIPDLAELLLALAQVVVFVVDYRRVHTESAKKWLELLQEKSIPILVCLTYADKLYAGHMHKDGTHPPAEHVEKEIKKELAFIKERLQLAPSCTVNYFSFCQDRDSVLNCPEGRRILGSVGVGSPHDVGDWLVEVFRNKLDQNELAERLQTFVHKHKEI